MSDSEPTSPQDSIDVRQLGNAVRLIAFVIVIGLSYLNMVIVRSIGNFERIFHDMLGGKPLPFATQFIIDQRAIFLGIAILIPSAALAALLTRRVVMGLYIIGAAGLVAVLEAGFIYQAMLSPMLMIMQALGAPPTDGL